jgi:hypothetical protein
MAKYPISGSTLDGRIVSGLSTLITIKVNNETVGALQTLTINQQRETAKWQEIGTDGFVENHPKNAANITADATRLVFDGLSITEAFSRGFFNLQAQRVPFDIQIIDRQSGDGSFAVVHTLHSCWFTRLSTPYKSDNFLITQTAAIDCLRVTTQRMGESAAVGGIRGIGYEFDTVERTTDSKGLPGRFDSAGSTYSNITGVEPEFRKPSGKIFDKFGKIVKKIFRPGQR